MTQAKSAFVLCFRIASLPSACGRLEDHKQIHHPVARIFIIIPLRLPGRHGNRNPGLPNQLIGRFIKAHHGVSPVIRQFIHIQHIRHPPHKLSAYGGDAPLFALPGFELVFFRVWRTASSEFDQPIR